jgi:hypothetical protein
MITFKEFPDLKTKLIRPDGLQLAMVDVRSAFAAAAMSATYTGTSEHNGVVSGHVMHGTTPIRVLSLRRWQALNLPIPWLEQLVHTSPPNQSIAVVRNPSKCADDYSTVRDVVKDCTSETMVYAFTLAEMMDWAKDNAPLSGVVHGTYDAVPFVSISTDALMGHMDTSVHPAVRWGHTWGFHAGRHPDGGGTVYPTVHVTRAFTKHYKRGAL